MTSRTRRLGLALVFATLGLVCAGPASAEPLACDGGGTTACFDLATNGPNLTHVVVDSGCGVDPSGFFITVDGEPVTDLHTDDGPCESIPRDVWFPLQSHQDIVQVCVSVQGADLEDLRVYGKAGDECIAATMP